MSSNKRAETINKTLVAFYDKPVARISIELFFSLVLVIILAIVAIKPTLGTIAQLQKEIEEKQQLVEKLSNKNKALNSASILYTQEKTKIELLSEALPPTPELITVLKMIERIASDSNIIIKTINVRSIPEETDALPTAKDAKVFNLPFTVTVVGKYEDIKTFVQTLDNSRRTFDVVSISFSTEGNRGYTLLQASISVNAPYFGTIQ